MLVLIYNSYEMRLQVNTNMYMSHFLSAFAYSVQYGALTVTIVNKNINPLFILKELNFI